MSRADFNPEHDYEPLSANKYNQLPDPDVRIANAAEYAAFQMGQIKVQLRRIADALEKSRGD